MTREEKCIILENRGYSYDPETGIITKVDGDIVKTISNNYTIIISGSRNNKIRIYAHQFAWWAVNKKFTPNFVIDHINRNKLDNRISNLIEKTIRRNLDNCYLLEESKGYTYRNDINKYKAQIGVESKHIHLGYFNTEQEARQAYLDALKIYYPERYKKIKGQSNEN
jgi:hypothetical protein